MKELVWTYKNYQGVTLTCRTIHHDVFSRCKEFVVERCPFDFRRWLLKCVCFTLAFYLVNLHNLCPPTRIVLLCLLLVILFLRVHLGVQKESLLVISSLGLQMTTTFLSGRKVSHFIETRSIEALIINEGITMHCILYYLAIILNGSSHKIKPLFQSTWPRLDFLIQVYQCVNALLLTKPCKK